MDKGPIPLHLSAKWQERFAFFDNYGAPGTKEHAIAYKALSSRKRTVIEFNFIAFFFGPIYFFVLGLWRKNLTLLGIAITTSILIAGIEIFTGFILPNALIVGISGGFSTLYSMTANYGYYLECKKSSRSWNPFEGMSGSRKK